MIVVSLKNGYTLNNAKAIRFKKVNGEMVANIKLEYNNDIRDRWCPFYLDEIDEICMLGGTNE